MAVARVPNLPFGFFRKDENERERQREQTNGIEQLISGGITPAATKRLESIAETKGKFFSTTMGAGAFLLSRQAGYEVITQVMGSAFVNIDFEKYSSSYGTNSCEINPLTVTYNTARILALNRLTREAETLGAEGVIDVKILSRRMNWGKGITEFTATGTAINVPGKPIFAEVDISPGPAGGGNAFFKKKPRSGPIGHIAGMGMTVGNAHHLGDSTRKTPFLSHLSGAEFWQLYQAGYWPTALVAGNCSYYIAGDAQTQKAQTGIFASLQNQELERFSSGLYHSRHQATNKLKKEVKASGGHGAVGVEVSSEIEKVKQEGSTFGSGLLVNFTAIGTAVRAIPADQLLPTSIGKPMLVINLSSQSNRQCEIDLDLDE